MLTIVRYNYSATGTHENCVNDVRAVFSDTILTDAGNMKPNVISLISSSIISRKRIFWP